MLDIELKHSLNGFCQVGIQIHLELNADHHFRLAFRKQQRNGVEADNEVEASQHRSFPFGHLLPCWY